MFNRAEALMLPCPKCGGEPFYYVSKMVDSLGRVRYPYICGCCNTRTQLYAKKEVFESKKHLDDNIIHMKPKEKAACEVCGKQALLEQHHWAPRKLFDDADNWPKSNLCRSCHEKWHQIMTGDLIRRHK